MAAGAFSTICAVLSTLLVIVQFQGGVKAHGSMVDPAQRSAMWAYGFNTPKNYNYNGLNCGGFTTQWFYNGGKCGFCGDNYSGRRANEDGGLYATGTIAKSYRQHSIIEVKVHLSANHGGWFEFRLCARNGRYDPLTQECLDRHLLYSPEGETRYYPGFSLSNHVILLQLPEGVSCDHCVLQWKYNGGNSWGCDESYRCCIGCGAQEQFYNCADVKILPISITTTQPYSLNEMDKFTAPIVSPNEQVKPEYKSEVTKLSKINYEVISKPEVRFVDTTTVGWIQPKHTTLKKKFYTDKNEELLTKMGIVEITDLANNAIQIRPTDYTNDIKTLRTRKTTVKSPYRHKMARCLGRGVWKAVKGMDIWCEQNCAPGASSPSSGCRSHCVCK